jgi:hypothetical protein
VAARAGTTSPFVKEKVPLLGSVESHFCPFPGVSCPKSLVLERAATYAVSVNSLLSVAVPKYFSP